MTWLPQAMQVLRDELPNVDVTVSSGYSPDLAQAVARSTLDLAFMRAEPDFDLNYQVVSKEPLVVLMPSDHALASHHAIRPQELVGESFIGMGGKARVLRAVIDDYLARAKVQIKPSQNVDNPAMVMSLVVSTRGVTLIPAYVENLMPGSVVSRPLAGAVPMIELAIGYNKSNASPILKLFLSRLSELIMYKPDSKGLA